MPNKKSDAFASLFSGAGEIRTLVQTYPPQAFYMFIRLLIVGKEQGNDKPTFSLDE